MASKSPVLKKAKVEYVIGDKSTKRRVDKSSACNAQNSLEKGKMKRWPRTRVYSLSPPSRPRSRSRRNVRPAAHNCFYCDWSDEVVELLHKTDIFLHNFRAAEHAMQHDEESMMEQDTSVDDRREKLALVLRQQVLMHGCVLDEKHKAIILGFARDLEREQEEEYKRRFMKEEERRKELVELLKTMLINQNNRRLEHEEGATKEIEILKQKHLMDESKIVHKQEIIDKFKRGEFAKLKERLVKDYSKKEEKEAKGETERLKDHSEKKKKKEEKVAKKETERPTYQLAGDGVDDVECDLTKEEDFEEFDKRMTEKDNEYKELIRKYTQMAARGEAAGEAEYAEVARVKEDVRTMTEEMMRGMVELRRMDEADRERERAAYEEYNEMVRQYNREMERSEEEAGEDNDVLKMTDEMLLSSFMMEATPSEEDKEWEREWRRKQDVLEEEYGQLVRQYNMVMGISEEKEEKEEKNEGEKEKGEVEEKEKVDDAVPTEPPTESLTPAERLKNYPIDLPSEHVSVQEVHAYLTEHLVPCRECGFPVHALPIPSCAPTRTADGGRVFEGGVPAEMTVFFYCEPCNSISEYGMRVPLRGLVDRSLDQITAIVGLAVDPQQMK
ncbi:hypothetical protein PRIPAC_83210 [Pristionchus pacificus]|uniref:Uncharacterized protein n=1 Tax=Pristionchus pacificus TaxID=54126 RepID=A0A2A6CCI8_PRIPA|nr:hypothetical protein PRIPAC_83210 [Pristionchus pacificus]|eukprot:PDM75810.1 hypothetical protein PRIPAC_40189 [Pristionchus pacificus]